MIRSRTGAVIINNFFLPKLRYSWKCRGRKKMKLRTQLTADGTIKKLAVIIDR